jgi:phage-related protein
MKQNVNNNLTSLNKDSAKEINSMTQNINNSMRQMEQISSSSMSRVSSVLNNGFNNISNTSNNAMRNVSNVTTSSMNSMVSSFTNGSSRMVSAANSSASGIKSAFSSLRYELDSLGYYAGIGLGNGLSSSSGYIYSVANSIASNVRWTIQRALDIHSPSRITTWMGEMLGQGLGNGMVNMYKFVDRKASGFADIIKSQSFDASAVMAGDASFTARTFSHEEFELTDDVKNQELNEPEFEVHNELVGDKIYTYIKRKEARDKNKDKFTD